MRSYIYTDPETLMRAQTALLDLGVHLLQFCDFVSEILREKYYEMMTLLLERGELDLSQLQVGITADMSVKQAKKYREK
jgi:hypothetical protein